MSNNIIMGMVVIEFLQPLAELLGHRVVAKEVEGSVTLQEIVKDIIKSKPNAVQLVFLNEKKEWDPKVTFCINGKATKSFDQAVKAGDRVLVIPPISGG